MAIHDLSDSRSSPVNGSAANALKHGLSSRKVLPQQLAERRDIFIEALDQEIQPRGVLERVLVTELGRHAASLEVANEAEAVALRVSPMQPGIAMLGAGIELPSSDHGMLMAMNTEAMDRADRYRRGHERGFYSAIRALQSLRLGRSVVAEFPVQMFASETACQEFLELVQASHKWRCPRCRNTQRRWLSARQRWECKGCGLQEGIRAGTIAARSPLSLLRWFRALVALIEQPQTTLKSLSVITGIDRGETLVLLRKKILGALAAAEPDPLVAALIEHTQQAHLQCASRDNFNLRQQNEIHDQPHRHQHLPIAPNNHSDHDLRASTGTMPAEPSSCAKRNGHDTPDVTLRRIN